MLPTKFRYISPNGFRGEEFLTSANQKQESSVAAMFVNGSGQNERSIYGRSSIEITHFVLIHLQTWLPQTL
jgi:hypothetical protein